MKVTAWLPPEGVPFVLEPRSAKLAPRTGYEAKFSLPYVVGAMLVRQRVDLRTFADDMTTDSEILRLAALVDYEARPYDTFPGAYPGGARVLTRDGSVYEVDLRYQRGSRENPMSETEILEKFRSNATLGLGQTDLDEAEMRLINEGTIVEALRCLRRARRPQALAAESLSRCER